MQINAHVKFENSAVFKSNGKTHKGAKAYLIITSTSGDRNYGPVVIDVETEVREIPFLPSSCLTCFLSVPVSPLPALPPCSFLFFLPFVFLPLNKYLLSTSHMLSTVP